MKSSFVRSVFVIGALHVNLLAQFTWTQVAGNGPSARAVSAMVYDSLRGRTVLFGGGGPLSDTWEWDGTTWWPRVLAVAPAARAHHAMAYDSQRGRVVMFGGEGLGGVPLGDTWEWDGSSWTQVATTGNSPGSRIGPVLVFDSLRSRTLLFGGSYSTMPVDTWEWDGVGWTQVSSTGPQGRMFHAMSFDSARGRAVLFGGVNGGNLGDTWEWDGSSWVQVMTVGPQARGLHSMVYDSLRGRTVLVGGSGNGPLFSDTWEWDGNTWVQAGITGPSARYGHAMAYDSHRHSSVLFGGSLPTPQGNLGDTWEFGPSPGGTNATATAYGVGCGNPALGFTPQAMARPIIGNLARANITNAPTVLAGVAMGWSNTFAFPVTLPFDLAGIGMPGCDLLQSNNVFGLPATTTALGLSFEIAIPNQSSLVGGHAYVQAYAFAPGVNATQVIVSNGIDWLIGNQ